MEIIQVTSFRTVSALFLILCFTLTSPSWDHMQEKRKNCILISAQLLHFVSHLLFPLDPGCNEDSWCMLVSRRMPYCARIWGLCPASSISCCFPTCHATKKAQKELAIIMDENISHRLIKSAKSP